MYEGQALLIRLEIHGILHEQTSVSHYNLGHLYKAIGAMDKARREFAVCKILNFEVDVRDVITRS